MADDTTQTDDQKPENDDQTTDSTATDASATDTTTSKPAGDLGDKGKKALEREREARKAAEKAQKDLEAKVREFEDRDKTENQRLTDELTTLKAEKVKADREAMVARVAMAHKLDTDDLDLLHGDTEEELTSRAKRISELKTAATAANNTGSADQGAKTAAKTDLPSQIKSAEAKGDFALAMRLKNQVASDLLAKT